MRDRPATENGPVPVGKVVLAGVLGGLLAGLFGVGGGIVMVPLFVFLLRLDQRTAVTTSLLAIIPISVLGMAGYAVDGDVDWRAGLLLGLGSILGGQMGVRLLHHVPVPLLQAGFAVLLLYSAYRLIQPLSGLSGPDVGGQWWLLALVGVAAGLLAGLLGIGGGIILVPALVLLAGLDMDGARGTSLMVVLLTALTASVTTVRGGHTATRVGIWAGVAGAPAALLAALVAQWIPQRQAAVLFAGLMVVAAVQLIRRAWAGWRADDRPRT